MAREIISLTTDEELQELSIRQRVQNGEIDNEVYETLTPEEQGLVRKILFETHGAPVDAPVALSAIEFTVFGLAKIFFKTQSGEDLTEKEQVFIKRFEEFANKHEITMDAGDWYVPYAEENMLKAKENRAAYKQRKIDITGSFFS